MDILAVAALGFFAVGYFVLAGADIGVGMALPYLGRGAAERRVVIAAIAPFFLGNEVWLVGTVGVLAGAFPVLEGKLLSGLFPAVISLLVGWIVRDMGLWLRGRAGARLWWALCDGAITAGSWTVALSWGWMLAGLLDRTSDRVIGGPFAVVGAVVIAALFLAHGLAFAALRLTGSARARARLLAAATAERRTFAVTSAAMVILPVAAGARLSPVDGVADSGTLAVLIPAILTVLPVLIAAQAWVWRVFRHRVTGPSYL
jgi:cytochrome bd ubiquinol oxidase subunit II